MARHERTERIRSFVLNNVLMHPDVVSMACSKFGITRQAMVRHMRGLVADGLLSAEGSTRSRRYSLASLSRVNFGVPLKGLEEDRLWREKVATSLGDLPVNVQQILHHSFTEMVNNAVSHSGGTWVEIGINRTAVSTIIRIADDGVGVFAKVAQEFELEDEQHAALELSKGKLTTDPDRHSGEGIFFTSRMCDVFRLNSGGHNFTHIRGEEEDWIFESAGLAVEFGTAVSLQVNTNARRTTEDVFNEFAAKKGDFAFSKTTVPVNLVRYGQEQLVSRSQAKRLLAHFEKFEIVVLNFSGVKRIGQAFADEVFRVFKLTHPKTQIVAIRTEKQVKSMISRAMNRV